MMESGADRRHLSVLTLFRLPEFACVRTHVCLRAYVTHYS